MRRLGLLAWLVVAWTAAWGGVSVANVVSGILVAALVLAVFPPIGRRAARHSVRPLAALYLGGYFLVKLVQSTLAVSRQIFGARSPTGIVAVPLHTTSEGVIALVADMTALTPGTLVLEIHQDPPSLLIHLLRRADADAAREQIWALERLAIRAFGTREARAALHDRERAAPGTNEGTR